MSNDRPVSTKNKSLKSKAIGLIKFISYSISFALAGLLTIACMQFGPEITQLRNLQLQLNKSMPISINEEFAVKAAFDHEFLINLDTTIPVKFPVSANLQIPINETFEISLDKTFPVHLDKPLRIKDKIRVITELPLDTIIETRVFGMNMKIPVKGSIPVDFIVPLDQDIQVNGELLVSMREPFSAPINQIVEAPVNFEVKGILPLETQFATPINTNINCTIETPNGLPVDMKLDLTVDDIMRGLSITG